DSIPDEVTYLSKIAEPSEQAFRSVLNPAFISRSGKDLNSINITQAYKSKNAWKKYKRNWAHQFETVDGVPAKRFKDSVKAAEDTFAEKISGSTLAFTGLKSLESGPIRIAVYWLTGDPKGRGLLRQADRIIVPSEPFNITKVEQRNSLRSLVNSRLIQSGMAIMHASLSMPVITAMNTLDNSLIQGFIDPALGLESFTPGGASHLDFIKENEQLFLSVKVSQV
ncbi:MAG: hypothetical protein HY811_09510, partial [Planctomycetes bacterium]|nr:hypothetical protein [Planctomycetota bacterium]